MCQVRASMCLCQRMWCVPACVRVLEAEVPRGGRSGRCVRVSEPPWEGGRPVQTRTARCHLGSSGDRVMSELPIRTDPVGPHSFSSHGSEGLVKPEPVSPSHKGPPRPRQLSRERGHVIPDPEVGTTASAQRTHGTVPI